MSSATCVFYLDDVALGGNAQGVLCDLQLVEQGTTELGLSLNHRKSQVISFEPTAGEPLLAVAPNQSVTNPDCASLLGSPLGGVDRIDQAICDKTAYL